MSFYSDKDFRKGAGAPRGGPKRTAISSDSSSMSEDVKKIDNVVERARIEREERAKVRVTTAVIIRIQAWWRGRSIAFKTIEFLRISFDSKINDVENLSVLLLSKSNIVFVPPVSICIDMAIKLTAFGLHGIEDTKRILKFCRCVLSISLSQMEPSKNIATSICEKNDYLLNRLSNSILYHCSVKIMKKMSVSELQVTTILLPCLRLLVGGGEPFRMVYAFDLKMAFQHIRFSLIKNNFFRRIRGILTMRSDHLVNNIDTDQVTIKRPITGSSADLLLSICIFIVSTDRNENNFTGKNEKHEKNEKYSDRFHVFCSEILSVPMMTHLLSNEAMTYFCRWELIGDVFCYFSQRFSLPLSPHDTFPSEQWLSGNIASMAPYLNINTNNPTTNGKDGNGSNSSNNGNSGNDNIFNYNTTSLEDISDKVLESYLVLLVFFYSHFEVPGVIQDKKGIVWKREGSAMTAASVPPGLKTQLLAPLSPPVCSALYTRILLAVRGDLGPGSAADRDGVAEALSTSGIFMSQNIIKEEQESSVWFSSKWALKIVNKMVSNTGMKGGLTIDLATSGLADEMMTSESVEEAKTPICNFTENSRLTGALCQFWSVLLPHAVFSPTLDQSTMSDNKSWKALSLLSFGTRTADRLWIAVEHPLEKNEKNETKEQKYHKEQNDKMKKLDSEKEMRKKNMDSSSHVSDKNDASKNLINSGSITGSFLNIFGFKNNPNPATKDESKKTNKNENVVSSIYNGSTGDIEDFANRIFLPSYHMDPECPDPRFSILITFATILKTILSTTDDFEFYNKNKPFPLVQYVRIIRTFKSLLFRILRYDPSLAADSAANSTEKTEKLYEYGCVRSISGVLSDLYLRWARRPFSATAVWVEEHELASLRGEIRACSPFAAAILREMPWCINFYERMKIFRETVDEEKVRIQGNDPTNPRSRGVIVHVRRSHVLLDGMTAFEKVGSGIKDKIVVKYINNFGMEESGIDIGGLFKDFLSDLSAKVFDPSYGLFSVTSDNLLYPNPSAVLLYPESGELEALYCFLGRVLGKAMFENITIQPQFAHFFLAFMHGRYNFMNIVNDLATLDQELYKNLMFLKNYAGDIEDLSLTFSVSETAMGALKEVDLIHLGSKVAVTSKNRHRYISAVAKYHLYDRLKKQARAFFSGMYQAIKPDLLSIFCAPELQILISGNNIISLKDLKNYTRYLGYSAFDRNISRLWAVLEELNAADSGLFLKFVTSCERPPSLGFASLQPQFTVQIIESNDDLRLPTASSCFNTLKLPQYSSQAVLKRQLLTSIRSNAGFDLS